MIGVGGTVGIVGGVRAGPEGTLEALGAALAPVDAEGAALAAEEARVEAVSLGCPVADGPTDVALSEVRGGSEPAVDASLLPQPPANEAASATTSCARMRSRRSGSNGICR
jgi:hypothetical protein